MRGQWVLSGRRFPTRQMYLSVRLGQQPMMPRRLGLLVPSGPWVLSVLMSQFHRLALLDLPLQCSPSDLSDPPRLMRRQSRQWDQLDRLCR